MRPERTLAAGAAVVLAVTVLLAALVPGIVATPEEDDVRPSKFDVTETTISPGKIGGSTATLSVTTRLEHFGGDAENVTVLFRATDTDTGLVATTIRRDLDTVEGRREVPVTANLSVPREGGYRIDTIVYEDGRRVRTGRTTVRGVGTLGPDYAESTTDFERFDGAPASFPAVEYSVQSVEGNRTTLNVSAYLTNAGDGPAGDVRLVVTARQVDSSIVADRASTTVGTVRAGRTVTPSVELEVPSQYNYYLDAVLWRDGVIVSTARAPASLDPTESVPVNTTTREVGLRVGEFAEEGEGPERTPQPEATGTPVGAEGPGFGIGAAAVALLGAGLLARRWSA
jgi:PGF-CTERM protein